MKQKIIIVCKSIHDVLDLEKKLLQSGIECDLIPTPRQFSSSCGMSICANIIDISIIKPFLSDRCRYYFQIDGAFKEDANS
jgi:hypothetical protein